MAKPRPKRGTALARIEALKRHAYYLLARVYPYTESWILTAWKIDSIIEEEGGEEEKRTLEKLAPVLSMLRHNLYTYISTLGAEWPAEDENTIVLRGGITEAGNALKALWLSLHIAYMTPAGLNPDPPEPSQVYPLMEAYARLHAKLVKQYKPLPFKLADQLLETAAYIAMTPGLVLPEAIDALGVHTIVADMLYALLKTMPSNQ